METQTITAETTQNTIACQTCGKIINDFIHDKTGERVVRGCPFGQTDKTQHYKKCKLTDTHCHCLIKWKEIPTKSTSPPPMSALPKGFSMGVKPHIPQMPQMPQVPQFNPVPFPHAIANQSNDMVMIMRRLMELTDTITSLKELCARQEQEILLLRGESDGRNAFVTELLGRVEALEQVKVDAGKTVTVQNQKPRHYVKPYVKNHNKPYKLDDQQPSEGGAEKQRPKKPFKPYHNGKKGGKFQGPKPGISQEPTVPEIVESSTDDNSVEWGSTDPSC